MSSNGISPLQWHPFTTIPGEQPCSMVSIIKLYGKWTGYLMDKWVCSFLSLYFAAMPKPLLCFVRRAAALPVCCL